MRLQFLGCSDPNYESNSDVAGSEPCFVRPILVGAGPLLLSEVVFIKIYFKMNSNLTI